MRIDDGKTLYGSIKAGDGMGDFMAFTTDAWHTGDQVADVTRRLEDSDMDTLADRRGGRIGGVLADRRGVMRTAFPRHGE